ncbi:MAG: IS21-like element helper ATPase IstB [Flavobacteriaceae bacterium]|nr:IS21-like element helper ATPase IstB [Flavobacteriaceae bacterium]
MEFKEKENKEINDKIISLTKEIGLPGIRNNFKILTEEFEFKENSYNQFLYRLLELEFTSRLKRRKSSRIRQANFPYKKYLEDIKRYDLPEEAKIKLSELEKLEFIKQGRNLIFAGNPGTGKTHIAIALGIKACNENFKVHFTTVPRLITQIKESRSEKTLRQLENRFEKYDLVICDEFGYISFDKAGAELLFSHLSLRAGLKSTIITTNLSFDRWNEIFGDTILTAAMVDRLTHKAHIVNMNGKSYRTKETLELMKK